MKTTKKGFPVKGWTYVRGVVSKPTKRASEKFSVANDDRNIPKSSRENDFMSWYCWVVSLKKISRPRLGMKFVETTSGRAQLRHVKNPNSKGSI